MNDTVWNKLQSIDPRVLYVVLLVIIAAPMLFPGMTLPIVPGQQSKDAFATIQKLGAQKPAKLVLLDGVWSASTRGESAWQTQAIMLQLMRLRIPFAIMSADPQNPQLMENLADALARKNNYVYGRDYINFGYQVAYTQTLKGIVRDIKGTLKTDWTGKPLAGFAIMANVNSIKHARFVAGFGHTDLPHSAHLCAHSGHGPGRLSVQRLGSDCGHCDRCQRRGRL